jgi:hypothetical protein
MNVQLVRDDDKYILTHNDKLILFTSSVYIAHAYRDAAVLFSTTNPNEAFEIQLSPAKDYSK